MAAGAFLLVLGGALIAFGVFLASWGPNLNSLFPPGASNVSINWAAISLVSALMGVILAPIGGAFLAYGIGANRGARTGVGPGQAQPQPEQTA